MHGAMRHASMRTPIIKSAHLGSGGRLLGTREWHGVWTWTCVHTGRGACSQAWGVLVAWAWGALRTRSLLLHPCPGRPRRLQAQATHLRLRDSRRRLSRVLSLVDLESAWHPDARQQGGWMRGP
jgi:hypothetical protein